VPNSTARLTLVEPLGTDAVTELRESIAANAVSLDAAVIVTEGSFSSRPATGLVYGQTYYGTDTGLWYFYTGSAWQTVTTVGPWVTLTLSSWFTTAGGGSPSPRYRLEGDKVVISGALESTTGWSGTATLTGVPAPANPSYLKTAWCQTNNT
jgi:hypothetical protein